MYLPRLRRINDALKEIKEYDKDSCLTYYMLEQLMEEGKLKLGLHNIAMSTQILRLCGKDKKFCKWLATNRNDIALSSYYVASIIKAYKTGKPIREIDNFATRKIQFDHAEQISNVKELVKNEVGKFLDYIEQQNTNFYSYRDYLHLSYFLLSHEE